MPNSHYVLLARALLAERAGGYAEAASVLSVAVDPDMGRELSGRYMLLPVLARVALELGDEAVAGLVAGGKSNPDIAAELFLSRNTVQTHVSHILTKLGARSRVDIAAEALRHAPSPDRATA